MGGTWVFDTGQVVHTQYIASTEEGKAHGALDLLFDELINRLATFKTEEEEKKDHACRFEKLGKDLIK